MQLEFAHNKQLRYIKAYTHGGVSLKKRRKIKRPLIPGLSTHVVFKSSKANGELSFYKHKRLVQKLLKEKSLKFFVKIEDFVNMGNHLHLKVKFKNTLQFQQFLKSFSALLARQITGARRGIKFGKFWDGLVYSRILTSKLEALSLKAYFEGNHRERELGYTERVFFLKRWNEYIYRLRQTRAAPKPLLSFIVQ